MEWVNKWVGLPYEELGRGPTTYDCLGLFIAVYESRFGIKLPDPMVSRFGSLRKKSVLKATDLCREVKDVQEGDALLFSMAGGSMHVGYALNNRDMVHLESESAGSCLERWRSTRWFGKLKGIYRYEM